ncbi:pyridoxamine 5'-phosphate oxidase family protein [Alteribacter populi]|uniref:pyridoxamine 5'-phosphate oxidase family protein n=1 Tax=Alteribacter populi TaxID=2011011 RepID=UPI000BBA9058|nr:pyridoxamine 5'-phosphate oxidase family protein [Alteribacter populi]
MFFQNTLTTEQELNALIGKPSELVQRKTIDIIDDHCKRFISMSPFLIISTSDDQGACDASPRGDAPGFVHVLDEKHLIIPERPGNKRMDSLRNILANDRIGLLFLIPSLGETLRINGTASIVKDEELLTRMAVRGKRPLLGIGVRIEECFVHCAKSIKRSKLWNSDTWPDTEVLPSAAKMLTDHAKLDGMDERAMKDRLEKGYREKLY